jgi:sugar/nucleoside kinase (ribokinase family)
VIDYFTVSLIIDDLVLPDGSTRMGLLGGGGPQAAFGMKLWTERGVGLCGSVGPDFPPEADAWLAALGIDTQGVRRNPHHATLRAWQILEADGRRTQVWRTAGESIPAHLGLRAEQVPGAYLRARGFHFGVHPERPNLSVVQVLRRSGMAISIEPFRPSARPLNDEELGTLLTACDIFSPNVEEARSLVGEGDPETLVRRLSGGGAPIVALRMGDEGSLIHRLQDDELHYIPAVPVAAVDPVGAGNAYCGAFLVGWLETGDLREAGLRAAVAGSFLVEQYGLPPILPDLAAEARNRLSRL